MSQKVYSWQDLLLVASLLTFSGLVLYTPFDRKHDNMWFSWTSASILLFAQNVLASGSDIRLNHIQVIGTHNSYHRELFLAERKPLETIANATGLISEASNLSYSHAELPNQLEYQSVRSLEFDLHSDEKGGLYYRNLTRNPANSTKTTSDVEFLRKPGIKVFHMMGIDPKSVCHTFIECLQQIKTWSDNHPYHVPITIDLELGDEAKICKYVSILPEINKYRTLVCPNVIENWTLPRILNVEAEILSVFPLKQLIRPDDVRIPTLTLEQSILTHGWPSLDSVRGRILFFFDNQSNLSDHNSPGVLYTAGAPSLENRIVFTNACEGSPDAAFMRRNEPQGEGNRTEIQRLVRKGYLVRTRADEPLVTVLSHDIERREAALASGAQIVSTDFPAWSMSSRWGWDYVVRLPGGRSARCNPLIAPSSCRDEELEFGRKDRRYRGSGKA